MLTLLARSFRRVAVMWVSVAVLLAFFQAALITAAASLHQEGDFERLFDSVPGFARQAIGPALTSFAGMSVLIFFEPLIIMLFAVVAVYVASEPAGDVESRLVDLILARPLPRHWLVTRSLVLMTLTSLALVLMLGAWNRIALALMAPDGVAWPTRAIVGSLMAHLFALTWCLGCMTLAASTWISRRNSVYGLLALVITGFYLIHALQELSDRFDGVGWVSPFHYYQGTAIMTGTAPALLDFSVLVGVSVVGVVLAYWQFSRRDV